MDRKLLTEFGLRALREALKEQVPVPKSRPEAPAKLRHGPPMGQVMDMSFGPDGERTRTVTKRGFLQHPIYKDFSDIDPDNYLGRAPDPEFVPVPSQRPVFAQPLPHTKLADTPNQTSSYSGPIPKVRPSY